MLSNIIVLLSPIRAFSEQASAPLMPPRASISLPICDDPPFDPTDFLAQLRVELLNDGVEIGSTQVRSDVEALITVTSPNCSDMHAAVRIDHWGTGEHIERELDLYDQLDSDRNRVLALAIAELLRNSWSDLDDPQEEDTNQPEPAPNVNTEISEPPPPSALETGTVDSAEEPPLETQQQDEPPNEFNRRFLLGAHTGIRLFPRYDGSFFGGRLFFDILLSRRVPFHLVTDIGYESGGGWDQFGQVEAKIVTGSLTLRFQGGSHRVQGAFGFQAELGWGWVQGIPGALRILPGSGDGLLFNLSATGTLLVSLMTRLWFVVEIVAGGSIVGIDSQSVDYHVGGLAGPLFTTSIGLAVGLGSQ